MTKRKRKTEAALGVLPDRYAARTDAIQPSLQTQIAQLQREATDKENQLNYYLHGSNYIVKPDKNGNLQVYMNDSDIPIPEEFIPRLRQSNRYIDMAFTQAPEAPTIFPLSSELVQEQRYSPEYQNVLRRQRQNVYGYNQAKQQAQTAMSEGLDYAVNPARWYNVGASIYNKAADLSNKYLGVAADKKDLLSKDDVAAVGLATMFVPGIQAGKLKGVTEIISQASEYLNRLKEFSELNINPESFKKIQNALAALVKNPSNANAIRILRTQFKANPELVADLESAKFFDGMEEFNQALQPFKVTPTGKPVYSLSSSKASEYEAKVLSGTQNKNIMDLLFYSDEGQKLIKQNPQLSNILARQGYDIKLIDGVQPSEAVITTAHAPIPQNQVKLENGKYLRSNGDGTFTELKDGDWFLDKNNQMRRVQSQSGKLTDLLESEYASQRRQQITAATEAKIKEAEQRGRDAAKKEMEAEQRDRLKEPTDSEEVLPYTYLPLKNGEVVKLYVNGNTAVDSETGAIFELYPGTNRVKQMDYSANPSFFAIYGKGMMDPDTGNPIKWKPASKGKAAIQWFYSKAGNPENPQRLVSNYGVWDFANKNKGWLMNNTREFSPKKAWATGAVLGATGLGFIQGNGLWGVGKSIGKGAANAGSTILFGNEKPWEASQDSTKKDTINQTAPSYQEPVDTADAWGISGDDLDAKMDSLQKTRQE